MDGIITMFWKKCHRCGRRKGIFSQGWIRVSDQWYCRYCWAWLQEIERETQQKKAFKKRKEKNRTIAKQWVQDQVSNRNWDELVKAYIIPWIDDPRPLLTLEHAKMEEAETALKASGSQAIPSILAQLEKGKSGLDKLVRLLVEIGAEDIIPKLLDPKVFLKSEICASSTDWEIIDFVVEHHAVNYVPQLLSYFRQFLDKNDDHAVYLAYGLAALSSPESEKLLLDSLTSKGEIFATRIEKYLITANTDYARGIIEKWKQRRRELGLFEYGTCPKCHQPANILKGSNVSSSLDRYFCPKCHWVALKCGPTDCPGYLEIECILPSGSYRYTCRRCGWTCVGVPLMG